MNFGTTILVNVSPKLLAKFGVEYIYRDCLGFTSQDR